jgi:hypothetical protein
MKYQNRSEPRMKDRDVLDLQAAVFEHLGGSARLPALLRKCSAGGAAQAHSNNRAKQTLTNRTTVLLAVSNVIYRARRR